MRGFIGCLPLVAWLLSVTAIAQPSDTSERRFALPSHGQLVLYVPRDWRVQLTQPPGGLPPTIRFTPTEGMPFRVLITPIWSMRGVQAPQTPDQLRAAVERGAQRAKVQAVEADPPIVEFQGRSGPGFYFSATDRAPKPGEYKFLTQGIVGVGTLSLTFTILTNDGQESIVRQALAALKGAIHDGI